MNNLNDIVQKSLGLINYNRTKHITEQVALKKPLSMDKIVIKDFTLDRDEIDTPFITLKSVVRNQDIHIPLRKVVEKTMRPETNFLKNLQTKYNKFTPTIPNDLSTFTNYEFKTKYEKPKIIKTIQGVEPFNRDLAEQYFGSQCLKLSGKHPKYDVGYSRELDYFVNDGGNRCVPIPYKVNEFTVFDSKTKKNKIDSTETFQLDLPKSVKLKNGNSIQKSKFKYEKGCKTLSYDECLELSWNNLYSFGTQSQGVYELEVETESLIAPMKEPTKSKKTYIGCISDEWFPWFNSFVGYIEKTNYKITSDSAGIKQGSKCLRKNTNDTGVNMMERSLSNLSSNIFTANVISNQNVENFPIDSAIIKSTGKDYNINAKYYDYTVDLNQWFVFGEKDYANYSAGINKGFSDYINTQNEEKNVYDTYLDNFYGTSIGGSILPKELLNQTAVREFRIGIGGGEEQFIRDERTLETLTTKHNELLSKYENNIFEYLKSVSKEYFKENEKLKPNQVVVSFLISKWNEILSAYRTKNFMDFKTQNSKPDIGEFSMLIDYKKTQSTSDTTLSTPKITLSVNKSPNEWSIDDFTIGYLYKNFGVVNLKNFFVKSIKENIDYNKLIFKKDNPFVIVTDYNNYNTKEINPLTISNTYNRTKLEGQTNGFLYESQTVDGVEYNNFTYDKISKNLSPSMGSDETPTQSEQIETYESQLKMYEIYDKTISDIVNTKIVIMGR